MAPQPRAYQPLLPVTYSQPLPQPQAVTYSQPLPQPQAVTYIQPLPQPQAAYAGYAPVPQQAVVTIEGSGATSLSPTNNCVICMSVFVCLCCCTSMGIVALVLALVTRVFRTDPSNAVKAVTFNRYAFRWAIVAIIAGIVIFVLRFIVSFSEYMYMNRGFYTPKFMDVLLLTFSNSIRELVYLMLSK